MSPQIVFKIIVRIFSSIWTYIIVSFIIGIIMSLLMAKYYINNDSKYDETTFYVGLSFLTVSIILLIYKYRHKGLTFWLNIVASFLFLLIIAQLYMLNNKNPRFSSVILTICSLIFVSYIIYRIYNMMNNSNSNNSITYSNTNSNSNSNY
jgi:4-hydroxybenzoate polyprenyltransferase